ncbi:MAG TPA: response regulator transcription factor [Puia sp.]|nr:response regulator transcription factor [Puia sp.]
MTESRTIGIVDDHTLIRKGLKSLIDLFPNYRVLFDVSNGDELIAQFGLGILPDILLLDIVMPVMDGYATAHWVRTNHPEVRILALSTMDAETSIIRMIKCGAKGYLLKDSEPAELKQAFDEVMSQGYYYNDLVSRKIIRSFNLIAEERHALNAFTRLSDRETMFLHHACSEKTYVEIAKEMFVSERTVDGYRDSLFKKLGVSTRVGLVIYAIRNGIVRV